LFKWLIVKITQRLRIIDDNKQTSTDNLKRFSHEKTR
jgi:hypothetical protein